MIDFGAQTAGARELLVLYIRPKFLVLADLDYTHTTAYRYDIVSDGFSR